MSRIGLQEYWEDETRGQDEDQGDTGGYELMPNGDGECSYCGVTGNPEGMEHEAGCPYERKKMKTYNYSPLKALWCRVFGHKWCAYDFEFNEEYGIITHIDKCTVCYKERYTRVGWKESEK
jgi:hypothetical protein